MAAGTAACLPLIQPCKQAQLHACTSCGVAAGRTIYHGPIEEVEPFFSSLGFEPPKRKAIPDFLQEVRLSQRGACCKMGQRPQCGAWL